MTSLTSAVSMAFICTSGSYLPVLNSSLSGSNSFWPGRGYTTSLEGEKKKKKKKYSTTYKMQILKMFVFLI